MIEDITLATLLTAAGAGIGAGIVTLFVDVLKVPFPRINGIIATFVAALILYVVVFLDANVWTLGAGFVIFLAWLFCSAAAFGLHKTLLASVSDKIGEFERTTP